jgi:hypothetical protein
MLAAATAPSSREARLPRSQLAVLPGTTHIGLVGRAEWLVWMVTEFLDAPMPS